MRGNLNSAGAAALPTVSGETLFVRLESTCLLFKKKNIRQLLRDTTNKTAVKILYAGTIKVFE